MSIGKFVVGGTGLSLLALVISMLFMEIGWFTLVLACIVTFFVGMLQGYVNSIVRGPDGMH